MTSSDLIGHRLVLLLMGRTPAGDADWRTVHGTVQADGDSVFLHRGPSRPPFPLESDWIPRVKLVSPKAAKVLAPAEFVLSLSVGPLPEGADTKDYVFTGVQLPP